MNWLSIIMKFLPGLITFILTLGTNHLKTKRALKEADELVQALADFSTSLAQAWADGKMTAAEIGVVDLKMRQVIKEAKDIPAALIGLLPSGG